MPTFPPIDDYAIIGDCRTAALVARSGTIEWLCLPDFDSPSIFAAILDRVRGGRFSLQPIGAHESSRRYLPGTAVLETTFATSSGRARVCDFFTVGDGEHRWNARLQPQRELIRLVEGLEGSVAFQAIVDPRPDYGRSRAEFVARPGFGWAVEGRGTLLTVRSDADEERVDAEGALQISLAVAAGERKAIGMAFAHADIAVQPAIGALAAAERDTAVAWWRAWSSQCQFAGPRRAMVVRSAITLKLLTYALSGAVVAAPTTSLPESIGAGRNWDYRFCWLRDASVTMHAFLGLGLKEEANAFLGWMLHATRLTRPELRILYDLHGRNDAREEELSHLTGYRDSRPVRIGNAAGSQLQLDTYGSVIMAVYEYISLMGPLSGGEMALLRDFGEVVCRRWQEPDHGIWEVRGERRHFTATKVMCWTALDRLVRLGEQGRVKIPLERFRANRDAIVALIEEQAFDSGCDAYRGDFGEHAGGGADAAVLLMGPVGYGEKRPERLRGTLAWITEELGRDHLLTRYGPGFDGDASLEGTFGICQTWAIEVMASLGMTEDAVRGLDRFAQTANDLGLFAEEYDVVERSSIGNFPQAFSHAGFITAALAVDHAHMREPKR